MPYNNLVENKPAGYIVPDGPGLTARALLGPLISDAPIGLALVDGEFRFVFINVTFAGFNGLPVEAHFDAVLQDVLPPDIWEQVRPDVERALGGEVVRQAEIGGIVRDGGGAARRWFLASYYPVRADRRSVTAVSGVGLVVSDITDRKLSEALVTGQNRILEGIVTGVPLAETLGAIVALIESQLPGTLCAIHLLESDGAHLRLGAAPGLPAAYARFLGDTGIDAGPDAAGPCGRAAFHRKPVASSDLRADSSAAEGSDILTAEGGIRGCRALPILGDKGETLGVLALFTTEAAAPADLREPDLVQAAAYLTRIAVERDREEARRRALLRDMLLSLTEGRLRLCWSESELPAPLPERQGHPFVLTPETLREFRWGVTEIAQELEMPIERRFDLETAVGEAAMNAVVHAGGGEGTVYADPERGAIQIWVTDHGEGIAEESLHRATLERGFTTAGSLGHGFWMILKTVDRIWLLTGPAGTSVVLEQDREPFEPDWLGIPELVDFPEALETPHAP